MIINFSYSVTQVLRSNNNNSSNNKKSRLKDLQIIRNKRFTKNKD